ncbi:MAG: RagB/SusD family nutrient uptake outer membrane protein [Bacteroidota bacterium]
MMKKFYLIGIAIVLVTIASCRKGSFLDNKSTASLNKAVTFADSANTMDFLAGLYIDIAYSFPSKPTATATIANNLADFSPDCDEATGRYPAAGNFDKIVTQGTFASTFANTLTAHYSDFYADIRNINIFLQNVDSSPLSAGKKVRVKGEARFLRALYYSYLMRYFGGIPLVGDKVFDVAEPGTVVRGTYDECVKYLVGELDAIAPNMPLSYTGLDYGRITKGACLALKARVLLYAASPLYNGGSTATSAPLIAATAYPTADANRWVAARDAAKAVMDLGVYALNTNNTTAWGGNAAGLGYGFYKLFIMRENPEFILPRPQVTGKAVEAYFNPKSRGGADFYYYPTQELVDKFPTIKGLPIATDIYNATTNPTGYNAANPYANRDPRMSATIVYNTSLMFFNTTKALAEVNTYVGAANDGIVAVSSNTATITGYYVRKMQDENGTVLGGNNVDRSLPVIRYAEILLNYAEASNETGNQTEALNTLRLLRVRAGITAGTGSLYGIPATGTQADVRTLIMNERSIELAFEGHRFFDIRRWKIASQIDGMMTHGMQITKTGSTYTYLRINVTPRYFKDIYYYFPIPTDDVTFNPLLLQNPGY